jgi:hypothetical protein
MKVILTKKETTQEKKISCLYKEFGNGVHLIQDKETNDCDLMVIFGGHIDVLFITSFGDVNYMPSEVDRIPFENFYQKITYIKKLSPDELQVEVRKNE